MLLPTIEEALRCIYEFSEKEWLEVSRRARKHMDNLGYTDADVCDVLYELTPGHCERLDWSHWAPDIPVATFRAYFTLQNREQEDELFVEVALRERSLYLLAFKLYGSPE